MSRLKVFLIFDSISIFDGQIVTMKKMENMMFFLHTTRLVILWYSLIYLAV